MTLSREEIRQAFIDIADEMEHECGNWQNTPDDPELTARIIKAAAALEKESRG